MELLKFKIVDVFAEEKFTGNQLAVFLDGSSLSDENMQKIAREINFSETTFILPSHDASAKNEFNVRIFTPQNEVPFAGHPTLGTADVIRQDLLDQPVKGLTLNLKIGKIPVTFDDGENGNSAIWMRQSEPIFGDNISAGEISGVLSLNEDDIDTRFPVKEVSTGLPFLIVPLKNLDIVKKAVVAKEKYERLIWGKDFKAIFIFSTDTYKKENDINARMFADHYGIPEDAATGSANGCLGGYLVRYSYFGSSSINLRVEQGYEINRPSLILLRAEENDGRIIIDVGGRVITIAEGMFI